MTRLWILGLSLVGVLLVLVAQAAPATSPSGRVKQTASPVATLAMDGPQVAYAVGKKVYVWNTQTGATSLMKGRYGAHTSEVAIAGKRVAWITRYVAGNSYQTEEHLFAAPIGSRSKLLASGRRYLGGPDVGAEAWYGRWIAGAVGSGKTACDQHVVVRRARRLHRTEAEPGLVDRPQADRHRAGRDHLPVGRLGPNRSASV